MKSKHISLLVISSVVAFFLGYLARAIVPEAPDRANRRTSNDATSIKVSSLERDDSRWAELTETNEELKERIEKLVRELSAAKNKAARFDCMRDLLRDRGNQAFLGIGFDRYLAPRNHGLDNYLNLEQISNIFGLSEEGKMELGRVVTESVSSIQAWETENAKLVEEENGAYSYEIPPVPEVYKKQFLESLGMLVNNEDLELVGPAIDDLYSNRLGKRNVLIKVEPGNGSPANDALVVQVKYETAEGAFNTEGSTTNMQDIPERWRHLFIFGE